VSDCYGCVCGRAHTHEEDEARAEKAEAALADLQEDMGDGERERDDLRAKLAAAEAKVATLLDLAGERADETDAAVARVARLEEALREFLQLVINSEWRPVGIHEVCTKARAVLEEK